MSSEEALEARQEVADCEREIATIKALLRNLGPASSEEEEEVDSNQLKVTFLKV
jgi:hypothetical protein